MATKSPPPDPKKAAGPGKTVREVELLRVLVSRQNRQVSAQWALHPQLKQDLRADELKEVTELMGQVTSIVGKRFARVLAETEPDKPGTA